MSVSVGDVVAELRAVLDRLDSAAITATRAQADAEQAHRLYSEAAQGTDHPRIRQAVVDSRTAGEKAGKMARLVADAADHLTAYVNAIAPGSMPDRTSVAGPSGEELVQDATKRSESRRNVDAFFKTAVRKVEDVQDTGKTFTELTEQGFKIFGNRSGPSGGVASGTGTPSSAGQPAPPPKAEVSDTVGNLLVVGIVVGVAAHRFGKLVNKGFVRLRHREDKDRTP
jgi:hypothetical protein